MTLFLVPVPPTLPGMILPMTLGRAPSRADWQHDRILADLGRESGGRPVTVAVIPNDNFFSVSAFAGLANFGLAIGSVAISAFRFARSSRSAISRACPSRNAPAISREPNANST